MPMLAATPRRQTGGHSTETETETATLSHDDELTVIRVSVLPSGARCVALPGRRRRRRWRRPATDAGSPARAWAGVAVKKQRPGLLLRVREQERAWRER